MHALRHAMHFSILGPACLLLSCGTLLCAYRWHLLLGTGTYWQALRLSLIGNFFNFTLPGAVTGDVMKIYALGKKSLPSIILDRLLGLMALVWISLSMSLMRLHAPYVQHFVLPVALPVALGMCLGLVSIFLPDRLDPCLYLRFPKKLLGLYRQIKAYREKPLVLASAFFLALSVQLIAALVCYILASGVGGYVTLQDAFLMAPLGFLATAIPLAPGGLGTGNAAFLLLFEAVGSQRGADVYSIIACLNISLSLPGAWLAMRSPHRATSSIPA